MEYSGFQHWGCKSFPRTLLGFNGKRLVVEAQLEEIGLATQLAPTFFDRPRAATVWSDCDDDAAWKLKNPIHLMYPGSARVRRAQETVVLHAVIEENEHVSNLRIVHAVDTELDQATVSANSSWIYERTTGYADAKGPAEAFLDVVFSLGN